MKITVKCLVNFPLNDAKELLKLHTFPESKFLVLKIKFKLLSLRFIINTHKSHRKRMYFTIFVPVFKKRFVVSDSIF